MKTVFKIFLLLAVTGYLIFAIVKFAQPAEDHVCEALDIEITDSLSDDFVTEDYVNSILAKNNIFVEGQRISQINLEEIETLMQEDAYIEEATCFCTAVNHLCIRIKPQHPILHVMTQNEDYYLDAKGATMPVGNFNMDLCIATGNITKDYARNELIEFASYIYGHEFWNNQIEQIHVVSKHNIELYPRVGDHIILLGSIDNYEDKLSRLMLFYKKGLAKAGWNKYSTINLSYDGQVVCTKRDKNKKKK